jgi:hypothetical protein
LIACSRNALVREKTKYIDVTWHFFKDHVEHGTLGLSYLPTDRKVADVLTKPLARIALTRHINEILEERTQFNASPPTISRESAICNTY